MIQGLDHAAVNISNLPRAVTFYQEVLGLRPVDMRDPETSSYFWLNFGPGQTLNLTLAPERTPNALALDKNLSTSAHLAFAAPEAFIEEVKARLEACNTPFHRSKTGLYFNDPDGNSLEVTCWRERTLKEAGQDHW